MKQTVTFRTRSKAEMLRDRIKAAAPGAFTSIYFLKGRYALTVSGDAPDDIITRCTKNDPNTVHCVNDDCCSCL